jgi:hypothetical protein
MYSPKFLFLPARRFLVLAITAIILTRVFLIWATPLNDRWIDLSIYQEVGELVVNGVDPYNPASKPELREKLRLNDHGAVPYIRDGGYEYYVSANLPGSTALYGLIEWLSGGSDRGWRLILIGGDVAIALAAFFLLRRSGVKLETLNQQLAFALGTVLYPSLLNWGTILAEDKQFQTALMLALAGLVMTRGRSPRSNAVWIGVIGGLSLLFKALGLFLAPVALRYFISRPKRELLIAIASALVVALPLFLMFDLSFIDRMVTRLTWGSSTPLRADLFHASPWLLIPFRLVSVARPLLCGALVLASVAAYLRGRIDLLNCSAAMCVVFTCLWITDGSMDRMNVAMLLALFCTATLSTALWRTLTWLNFLVQVPIYAALFRHSTFAINPENAGRGRDRVFPVLLFQHDVERTASGHASRHEAADQNP